MPEQIRALLKGHVALPDSDEAPISLSSFEVVVLVEDLEEAFEVRIPAAKVTPEAFGSIAGIAALVNGVKG